MVLNLKVHCGVLPVNCDKFILWENSHISCLGCVPRTSRLMPSFSLENSRSKVFGGICSRGLEVYYACSNVVWPQKGHKQEHGGSLASHEGT